MSTMEQKLADQKHEQRNHRTEEISAPWIYAHKYEKNRDGVRLCLCGPIFCNKHTHRRKKKEIAFSRRRASLRMHRTRGTDGGIRRGFVRRKAITV